MDNYDNEQSLEDLPVFYLFTVTMRNKRPKGEALSPQSSILPREVWTRTLYCGKQGCFCLWGPRRIIPDFLWALVVEDRGQEGARSSKMLNLSGDKQFSWACSLAGFYWRCWGLDCRYVWAWLVQEAWVLLTMQQSWCRIIFLSAFPGQDVLLPMCRPEHNTWGFRLELNL